MGMRLDLHYGDDAKHAGGCTQLSIYYVLLH